MTMLPVAILAGGMARRLGRLAEATAKALVDVNGEPFIAHQLRLLRASGIGRVVVCAGHLGEQVQEFVGDGGRFGVEAEFSFDGGRPLGTAGAIRKALGLLGRSFFVVYGDSYLSCDYGAVQTAFEKSGKWALMTVFRNEGRWDRSNVRFEGGRVLACDKQNPMSQMHHIDYGLGVFHAAAFALVPSGEFYDLTTLYQDLLLQDQLAAYEIAERFYEIGSLAGLEETRRYLRRVAPDPVDVAP